MKGADNYEHQTITSIYEPVPLERTPSVKGWAEMVLGENYCSFLSNRDGMKKGEAYEILPRMSHFAAQVLTPRKNANVKAKEPTPHPQK